MTTVGHEMVKKTKYGVVTILEAGDPVVRFIGQKLSAIRYEPHQTRRKVAFGFEVAVPMFVGGIMAGIGWMRRRRAG